MHATGIHQFYSVKYDEKSQAFWDSIGLPNKPDKQYICIGVKASNYFMPQETLSLKGPGGGGWIHFNEFLQVTTKPAQGQAIGEVWGDGTCFAIGHCNYGCIGDPSNWVLPPIPKISYPVEEQALHGLKNLMALDATKHGGGCCANKKMKPNWWIPAALQKEVIETTKINECKDSLIGVCIWHFVHHTPVHLWGKGAFMAKPITR